MFCLKLLRHHQAWMDISETGSIQEANPRNLSVHSALCLLTFAMVKSDSSEHSVAGTGG